MSPASPRISNQVNTFFLGTALGPQSLRGAPPGSSEEFHERFPYGIFHPLVRMEWHPADLSGPLTYEMCASGRLLTLSANLQMLTLREPHWVSGSIKGDTTWKALALAAHLSLLPPAVAFFRFSSIVPPGQHCQLSAPSPQVRGFNKRWACLRWQG